MYIPALKLRGEFPEAVTSAFTPPDSDGIPVLRAGTLCTSTHALCHATFNGPGPALVSGGISSVEAEPEPEAAAAAPPPKDTSFGGLGKRNGVGLIVLSVLVFAGLVLWLTFGKWPRRVARKALDRILASRRGGSQEGADSRAPAEGKKRPVPAASLSAKPALPDESDIHAGLGTLESDAAKPGDDHKSPRVHFA